MRSVRGRHKARERTHADIQDTVKFIEEASRSKADEEAQKAAAAAAKNAPPAAATDAAPKGGERRSGRR